MSNTILRLSIILWCVGVAEAAGGLSIFLIGKEIDLRPWEVFAMYFMVIIVSVFYELLTHHIDHMVTSNSGKAIVTHIYKEVMILGGISLLLTIMENSGGDLLFEPIFFHYVHFVIFFMAINLIVSVSVLFLFINRSWLQWSFFEHVVSEIENDPRADLETRTALLSQYVKRSPGGHRMLSCLLFFRSNLPAKFKVISFTRYMKKQQRKELLSFLDLHASAWGALTFLVLLVAVQTYAVEKFVGPESPYDYTGSGFDGSNTTVNGVLNQYSAVPNTTVICDCTAASGSGSGDALTYGLTFDLVTISMFIAVEGYGTMGVILVCYLNVMLSYNKFSDNIEAMRKEKKLKPIVRQNFYFWRGNPHNLMALLQVMLLYQVFYLATITTNLAPRLWKIKGGVVILLASVIPTVLVFVVLIPKLMPLYTILKSVGDLLDLETLQDIQISDEASGRWRRLSTRLKEATAPPPFITETLRPLDDEVQQLILLENRRVNPLRDGAGHKPDGDSTSETDSESDEHEHLVSVNGHGHHGHGHGKKRPRKRPEIFCEECAQHPAVYACGVCGMLCFNCDSDYHKLKKNQDHLKINIKTKASRKFNDLKSDKPLFNALLEKPPSVHSPITPLSNGMAAL